MAADAAAAGALFRDPLPRMDEWLTARLGHAAKDREVICLVSSALWQTQQRLHSINVCRVSEWKQEGMNS